MPTVPLILVDLQHDFFDPRIPHVGRLEKAVCLPSVRALVSLARRSGWPILHVVTEHSGTESLPVHLVKSGVPPYCIRGTAGVEIIDGLFAENDVTVGKAKYSGFHGTELVARLSGFDTVLLAGVAADCCILSTALDAVSHGKNVVVPYQAVSATTPSDYLFGMKAIAKSAGAVVDLQTVLESASPSWWDARLRGAELETTLGRWSARQQEMLDDFRRQQAESESAREMVARLEEFLANRSAS